MDGQFQNLTRMRAKWSNITSRVSSWVLPYHTLVHMTNMLSTIWSLSFLKIPLSFFFLCCISFMLLSSDKPQSPSWRSDPTIRQIQETTSSGRLGCPKSASLFFIIACLLWESRKNRIEETWAGFSASCGTVMDWWWVLCALSGVDGIFHCSDSGREMSWTSFVHWGIHSCRVPVCVCIHPSDQRIKMSVFFSTPFCGFSLYLPWARDSLILEILPFFYFTLFDPCPFQIPNSSSSE